MNSLFMLHGIFMLDLVALPLSRAIALPPRRVKHVRVHTYRRIRLQRRMFGDQSSHFPTWDGQVMRIIAARSSK